MFELIVAPFADYAFMRRALLGCIALSLAAPPIGVFLTLRRMSLVGDAMSHAILPGVAVGYLVAGFSLLAMSAGGLIAGMIVALASGGVSRLTIAREDSSLAAFYLIFLALGVMMISARGTSVDLMQVLFGGVLSLDNRSLFIIGGAAIASLFGLAAIYRPLILESIDPTFFRTAGGAGMPTHFIFLGLVVLTLVGGFVALGTLLAVGIMLLPAGAARFCTGDLKTMLAIAIAIALGSSIFGLLLSYHLGTPSGPSIVLGAGMIYIGSAVRAAFGPRRHLQYARRQ